MSRAVKELIADLSVVLRMRTLLLPMVRREMATRTAGTALGAFWLYLQPLLILIAYYYLFGIVFAVRMGPGAVTERLGVYLIVGLMPWLAIADGVGRAAGSLIEAGSLLQKNALPVVLFPLRTVLASAAIYAPLIALLVPFSGAAQGFSWAMLWVVPLWLALCAMVLLLGLLVSLLTAASRDTAQVLALALSIGLFVSPVLYPVDMVPAAFRWALWLNPATPLVLGFHAALLAGTAPPPQALLAVVGWLLLLGWLAARMLHRCREQVVDWL
jgi:lipopolysaccharide transport system permease protein